MLLISDSDDFGLNFSDNSVQAIQYGDRVVELEDGTMISTLCGGLLA